jgi:hypothetical protein
MVLIALVLLTSHLPLAAQGSTNLLPAQGNCPTYLTTLLVDFINSSPIQITVGDVVTTTFHAVYPDGTPAQLTPETGSFLWSGVAGQTEIDNIQVTYTGHPGYYNYTQKVTADIAQATVGSSSTGKITIKVTHCSLSDALGNRGPTNDIGSNETLTPSDNSNLNVGPQIQPQQPVSYLIPLLIAILLIIAILLFLRRSRGKKKK